MGKCTHPPLAAHPSFGKELKLRVIVSTFVQRGVLHLLGLPHRESGLIIYKNYKPGGVILLALKLSLNLFMVSHKSLNKLHILTVASRLCMIWCCFPCQAPL